MNSASLSDLAHLQPQANGKSLQGRTSESGGASVRVNDNADEMG